MAIKLSVAARNALADGLATSVGNAGLLRIYTLASTAPASVSVAMATGDTLLAELVCPSPFGSGSAGKLVAGSISQDSSPNASGTAEFFRVCTASGTAKIQGTVGTTGTDMLINDATVHTSQPFQVTTFELTMPGA